MYNKAKWKHICNIYITFSNGNLTHIILMMTAYIWSSPRTIFFFFSSTSQLITGKSSWVFRLRSCNISVTVNILVRRTQTVHFHSIQNVELLVENYWKLKYFSKTHNTFIPNYCYDTFCTLSLDKGMCQLLQLSVTCPFG